MEAKLYILDRIEEKWATLEPPEGPPLQVPAAWLPQAAAEGDALRVSVRRQKQAARIAFERDEEATEERREQLQRRRDRLARGPEGDLSL